MATILIIDDDEYIRSSLSARVKLLGHKALAAEDLTHAREIVFSQAVDLIFLDVILPDADGLKSLREFRGAPSQPEVIIITGGGNAEGAAKAIKGGAWDYLLKPFSREEINLQITRALEYRRMKFADHTVISLKREGLIGDSTAFVDCLDQVAHCAVTDTNVLVSGETGTGKELFARAIHRNSRRSEKPLVVVDCTAMPEDLIERELFGHVKGAFTGANKNRTGLVKEAHGGSLFLDEVGELPLAVQKKFLRVLQEKSFRVIGDVKLQTSNFRLITSSNRDLDRLTEAGKFRKDLLFRLRTFDIQLPPLRERRDDVEALSMHYVPRICRTHGIDTKAITPETMEVLSAYDWPGNIRELMNVLERAILADLNSPQIFPLHLPGNVRLSLISKDLRQQTARKEPPPADVRRRRLTAQDPGSLNPDVLPTLHDFRGDAVARTETHYLRCLMEAVNFQIDEACKTSGLSKSRLYALLRQYDIIRKTA